MNVEQLTDQLFEAISLVILAQSSDGQAVGVDEDGEEYTIEWPSGNPEERAKAALRAVLERLATQKN